MFTFIVLLGGIGVLVLLYFGPPYVPSRTQDLQQLRQLMMPATGELFHDLGAGDGRVVLLAAEAGYQAIGYEINPLLYLVATWRCRKTTNAHIFFGDWRKQDLSGSRVLFVFTTSPHFTRDLPLLKQFPNTAIIVYGGSNQELANGVVRGPYSFYGDLSGVVDLG